MKPGDAFRDELARYLAETGESRRSLSRRAGLNLQAVQQIMMGRADNSRTDTVEQLRQAMEDGRLARRGLGGGVPASETKSTAPGVAHPATAANQLLRAWAAQAIANAGPRLRATREALNIRSAAELAAEIGADPAEVERWEAGIPPDLSALAVLALMRDVPMDWLLLGLDSSLPPLLRHAFTSGGHAGLRWRGGLPTGALPDQDDPGHSTLHSPGYRPDDRRRDR